MSIAAVIIDSREPKWAKELSFGPNVLTSVAMLNHGDLLATTDDGVLVAVERKTAQDLLGSLKDGRLWHQLAGMKQQTPWAYLVITGRLTASERGRAITDYGESGWNWASVQGALIRAQELGVFVTQVPGDVDYAPAIVSLCGRSHKPELAIEPVRQPIPMTRGEQILASLPGIGVDKTARLLSYTTSPGWALTFLTDQDTREMVPGIGPVTKKRIREALGLHKGEVLSVICDDTGQVAVADSEKEN